MKLTAKHFPISCSLEPLVLEAFGSGSKTDLAQEMPLEELLGYLRKPTDLDLTPYADLLSQTEEIGDPSLPSARETAILRWVGEALHHQVDGHLVAALLRGLVRLVDRLDDGPDIQYQNDQAEQAADFDSHGLSPARVAT